MRFLAAAVWICAAAAQDDFTPPKGPAYGYGAEEDGAWRKRILTATSPDGLVFTRTGQVVTDQGNVPDFILAPDGKLFLYYSAGIAGDRNNVIAAAISSDGGKSWNYRYVTVEGAEGMPPPGDPDARLLPDGTYRLFFTSAARGVRQPAIFYADGTDGLRFTLRGPAFVREGEAVMDSFTLPIGDRWHMYTLADGGALWHAVSSDGERFEFHDRPSFTIDRRPYIPTNEVALDDGRTRFYAFTPGEGGDIRSFVTSDGFTWEAEPGVRLALDAGSGLERKLVKDAAVVKLEDGSYLMAYVTLMPE